MPLTPTKGHRLGSDPSHQKALLANLVASLVAAEYLVTTEAKAKALRPIAERMITKAKKGGVANQRQVISFMRDKDMTAKLFNEIGPHLPATPVLPLLEHNQLAMQCAKFVLQLGVGIAAIDSRLQRG